MGGEVGIAFTCRGYFKSSGDLNSLAHFGISLFVLMDLMECWVSKKCQVILF